MDVNREMGKRGNKVCVRNVRSGGGLQCELTSLLVGEMVRMSDNARGREVGKRNWHCTRVTSVEVVRVILDSCWW